MAKKDEDTARPDGLPGSHPDPNPAPAQPGDGPEPGRAVAGGAPGGAAEPGSEAESAGVVGAGSAAKRGQEAEPAGVAELDRVAGPSGVAESSAAGETRAVAEPGGVAELDSVARPGGVAESSTAGETRGVAEPSAAAAGSGRAAETPGLTSDRLRVKGRSPDPILPGQSAPVVDPPKPVKVSFWLWIAAGVVVIVGQAYTLLIKDQLITELIKQNQQGTGAKVAPEQIASGTTTLVWLLLIGAVVFAVLLGLFAWKAREGTRSARSVLTGLAIVCVLFQIVIFYNFFTLIAAFVLLIALVLMYLPSVAEYFPKVGKKLP